MKGTTKNQKETQNGQQQGALYPNNPQAFLDDLRVEYVDLSHLPKSLRRGCSAKTLISFASTSKMSNFMAVKVCRGISVNKDREEMLFKPKVHSLILDIASAMNQYYYYEEATGVKRVGAKEDEVFHPYVPRRLAVVSRRTDEQIVPFFDKTALLLKTLTSAEAIMLNRNGTKKNVLKYSNLAGASRFVVDVATCDHKLGYISSLFTLGEKGKLSCFKVSKGCKVLARIKYSLPKSVDRIYGRLAVSRDGEYAAVLYNNTHLMVLKLGLGRRVKVLSTIKLSISSKEIRCLGFYEISEDIDHGEAMKHNLRFLYWLGDCKFYNSQIAFLTFNIGTHDLCEVSNLVKELSNIYAYKCVENREGGNWIVTSGKSALHAKFRLVLFDKKRDFCFGWLRNRK